MPGAADRAEAPGSCRALAAYGWWLDRLRLHAVRPRRSGIMRRGLVTSAPSPSGSTRRRWQIV
jgi:hypothetical protein